MVRQNAIDFGARAIAHYEQRQKKADAEHENQTNGGDEPENEIDLARE